MVFETPENYQTYDEFNAQRVSTPTENYCINVCFWIVRDNDGTNTSFNASNIPQQLTKMNTRFNPHGIFFNQIGVINYLSNTNFNNGAGPSNTTNIQGCLNIFFVNTVQSGETWNGIAQYSYNRLRVRGASINNNSETLNHEVGHCLNLAHTFLCTYIYDSSCVQSPYNNNNCTALGYQICDTPADYYNLNGIAQGNSPYPANAYNPDVTNIMSYWPSRNHFTNGQGDRMKNSIISSPALQSIRSSFCYSIVGPSRLCQKNNQNGIYSVSSSTFTTPPSYNWSVSGNLQINGPSTNSTVNISHFIAGSSPTP